MSLTPVERAFVAVTALASVVLCVGALVCIPVPYGADEPAHLDYAAYIFEHHSLPGTEWKQNPQATQQPFLYYAYVGAWRSLFAGPAPRSQPAMVLPYERHVTLDLTGMPEPRCPLPAHVRPSIVSGVAPYVWRLSGLPLLVIVIACVFRTARLCCGERALAALAAATAVLIPPVTVAFSTITNDQFAILFGSLGFAPIAIGAARGQLRPGSILVSGFLFALGFLSKCTVVGAFTSAAFIVWFHAPRPIWARLRDTGILVIPSLVGAAWSYIGRMLDTGHTDLIFAVGATHSHLLRTVTPDWLGYADTIAGTLLTSVGVVGNAISAGSLFALVGATVPVLLIGGSIGAVVSRTVSRNDRVIAGSFLAGVAVLVVLVLIGTNYSFLGQGRHMLNLVVPATLAGIVAMRHLFGRRAAQVLAAFVTFFGISGFVLLHGVILPRFHAPHDRFSSPDLAAYIDAGGISARQFIERGEDGAEPTWAPRPEGTYVTDPEEVRIKVRGLDPEGAHVAWVRVHPISRELQAQDFWADELPLGGRVTAIGAREWLGFTIPVATTLDGEVTISAKAAARCATIAELLITKLPLAVETPATIQGDRVGVEIRSSAPDRLPPLEARVRPRSGGRGACSLPSGCLAAAAFSASRSFATHSLWSACGPV